MRNVQDMDLINSAQAIARHDNAEQRGNGVRDLHQCFQDAATSAEFEEIAAEGERRRGRPDVQPPVETAYDVVISLARQRAHALAGGASAEQDASKGRQEQAPCGKPSSSCVHTMPPRA